MNETLIEEIRIGLNHIQEKLDSMEQLFLDTRQASSFLNLSESYLVQLRKGITGPPYVKIGGAVRYSPEDLKVWAKGINRRGN